DAVEERRLAGPVRPDHRMQGARGNREADVVDRFYGAEMLRDGNALQTTAHEPASISLALAGWRLCVSLSVTTSAIPATPVLKNSTTRAKTMPRIIGQRSQ